MDKEILEGNTLIAEFMGLKRGKGNNILLFHASWDWLMPVLAKIGYKTGHELVIHSETSYWNQFGDNALPCNFLGYEYPLQDGIWRAVVEFIKWYNSNN